MLYVPVVVRALRITSFFFKVASGENDTEVLMNSLENAESELQILEILQKIEGPYAFVYYKAKLNKLYFGRDCLGRRSLLWYKSENGPFMLSSVGMAPKAEDENKGVWGEVPANGIYHIDLAKTSEDYVGEHVLEACGLPVRLFSWIQGIEGDTFRMLESGQLVRYTFVEYNVIFFFYQYL